jgi:3-phenylpropionate/cinnamic acid dioxygenase small subunit
MVQSNLLLYRNRGDVPHADLLSAVRQDVLRRVNGNWRLARRTIVLDQSTVATLNLAVLL